MSDLRILRLLDLFRAPHPLAILFIILVIVRMRANLADVSRSVERTLACRHIVGLSVAVVRGNDTLLAQGYGMADIAKGVPMTADTPVPLGSVGKAFTVEILAQLLVEDQEHGYSWDTPVSRLLDRKDFRFSTPRLTSEVTLRDLLAHRVGIRATSLPLQVGFPANTTREDLVRMVGRLCPRVPLRHQFVYNNYLYALAGYVAEVLAGDVIWEELIRQRIFDPLGMRNSDFVDSDPMPAGLARPYGWNGSTWTEVDMITLTSVYPAGPAGSISSTANDITAWMKFILGRATQTTPEIVNEIFQPQMVTSHIQHYKPTYPIAYYGDAYGLGWRISNYRGFRNIHHSGGISTYISHLSMLPDVGVAVFVASNGPLPTQHTQPGTEALMMHLLDLAVGLEPWLAGEGLCSYPTPWSEKDPEDFLTPQEYEQEISNGEVISDLHLHHFVGRYIHPAFGTIDIVMNATDSHLHLRWGRLGRAKLYRIILASDTEVTTATFRCVWEGPYAYDKINSIDVLFNATNEADVVPALGLMVESTVDYFVRESLFRDEEWTCPNIADITARASGTPTAIRNSFLSLTVTLSGIVCAHIHRR